MLLALLAAVRAKRVTRAVRVEAFEMEPMLPFRLLAALKEFAWMKDEVFTSRDIHIQWKLTML